MIATIKRRRALRRLGAELRWLAPQIAAAAIVFVVGALLIWAVVP